MSESRAIFVLAIFVGGIFAGVVAQRVTDPGVKANPYPALEKVAEPPKVRLSAFAFPAFTRSANVL